MTFFDLSAVYCFAPDPTITGQAFRMDWPNGDYQLFNAADVVKRINDSGEVESAMDVRNVRYGSIYDREGAD